MLYSLCLPAWLWNAMLTVYCVCVCVCVYPFGMQRFLFLSGSDIICDKYPRSSTVDHRSLRLVANFSYNTYRPNTCPSSRVMFRQVLGTVIFRFKKWPLHFRKSRILFHLGWKMEILFCHRLCTHEKKKFCFMRFVCKNWPSQNGMAVHLVTPKNWMNIAKNLGLITFNFQSDVVLMVTKSDE